MDAAARSLGAGTLGTFLRVHAPLLSRSAAAALLLVFVDVMKELPATLVLRPFNFDTLATQAYTLAHDERLAEAAVPSLAIVAVGLIPILRAVARGRCGTRRRGAASRARDRVSVPVPRALSMTATRLTPAGAVDDLLRGGHFLRDRGDRDVVGLEVAHRLERRVLHLDALDRRPLVVAVGEVAPAPRRSRGTRGT